MASVTGVAIEKTTGNPAAYASVQLRNGSSVVASQVASQYGRFSFSSSAAFDNVLISCVGFKTKAFAIPAVADAMYFLEKDEKELDPVVLTPKPKATNYTWAWALLGLVVIAKNQ